MRRKSTLLIGLAVFVSLVITLILLPGEPSYQGIKLSEWLEIVCPLSGTSAQEKAQGKEAIRRMGAAALPWLVTWFKAKGGKVDHWCATKGYPILVAFSLAHLVRWHPAADRNFKAMFGFKALGKAANPAIPELLGFVQTSANVFQSWRGVRALSAIGSEQALDAVMSLEGSRPYFDRQSLLSTFLSANPQTPEYVWRKYEWGYPRRLGPRQLRPATPDNSTRFL